RSRRDRRRRRAPGPRRLGPRALSTTRSASRADREESRLSRGKCTPLSGFFLERRPGSMVACILGRLMISFLYYLYERRLLREIRGRPVPRHVGIILDGNRRYAIERGFVDPLEAYALGARKLDDVLLWCGELSIPAVSLWVFSTENFRRDASEVSGILKTVEAKLVQLARHPRTHRLGVRVRAVGKLDLLPDSVVAAIREAEDATAANRGTVLTIAVAYGGRQEIIDAMQAMLREKAKQGEDLETIIEGISAETFAQYLYAPDLPDPDLIIRTSGEVRLSGFMLWQSAYSEFYFCDIHWPALRKIDFLRAVRAFQQRDRRFGDRKSVV